jgi:hypothetical protein
MAHLSGSDLGHPSIDEQFRTGNLARLGGRHESAFAISSESPNLPSGTLFAISFFIFTSASPC